MHFFSKRLGLNKAIEVGYQTLPSGKGFDYYLRLNTCDDHAGLSLHIQWGKKFFEFDVYDVRHWNYEEALVQIDPPFEGYPHE